MDYFDFDFQPNINKKEMLEARLTEAGISIPE